MTQQPIILLSSVDNLSTVVCIGPNAFVLGAHPRKWKSQTKFNPPELDRFFVDSLRLVDPYTKVLFVLNTCEKVSVERRHLHTHFELVIHTEYEQ